MERVGRSRGLVPVRAGSVSPGHVGSALVVGVAVLVKIHSRGVIYCWRIYIYVYIYFVVKNCRSFNGICIWRFLEI